MAKSKEFTEEDWEFICNAIKLLFSAIIFILTPKNLAKIFLVLIELILLACLHIAVTDRGSYPGCHAGRI